MESQEVTVRAPYVIFQGNDDGTTTMMIDLGEETDGQMTALITMSFDEITAAFTPNDPEVVATAEANLIPIPNNVE